MNFLQEPRNLQLNADNKQSVCHAEKKLPEILPKRVQRGVRHSPSGLRATSQRTLPGHGLIQMKLACPCRKYIRACICLIRHYFSGCFDSDRLVFPGAHSGTFSAR
jgi:hypothetical protein